MDPWQEQWMKMEARVAQEAINAAEDTDKRDLVRFSADYLEGLADGLKRAVLLIEAFRRRLINSESEQQSTQEFSLDEEW